MRGVGRAIHHFADVNLIKFQGHGVEISVDADGSTQHQQASAHVACEADVTRLPRLEVFREHFAELCQPLPHNHHEVVSVAQSSQCFTYC